MMHYEGEERRAKTDVDVLAERVDSLRKDIAWLQKIIWTAGCGLAVLLIKAYTK